MLQSEKHIQAAFDPWLNTTCTVRKKKKHNTASLSIGVLNHAP